MIEANNLTNGSINDKFRYLLSEFGSAAAVLAQVRGVLKPGRPLKALALDKYEALRNAKRRKR